MISIIYTKLFNSSDELTHWSPGWFWSCHDNIYLNPPIRLYNSIMNPQPQPPPQGGEGVGVGVGVGVGQGIGSQVSKIYHLYSVGDDWFPLRSPWKSHNPPKLFPPPPQAKNEWSSFPKFETVLFEKVLMGNTDYKTAVGRILNPAIIARFVKINVKSYSGYPSLRVELFGCSDGMWLVMSNFW